MGIRRCLIWLWPNETPSLLPLLRTDQARSPGVRRRASEKIFSGKNKLNLQILLKETERIPKIVYSIFVASYHTLELSYFLSRLSVFV